MFMLTTLTDLIPICPQDFGKPTIQALEDNINQKYVDRVIQKIGLCICLYDILSASDGVIGSGTGNANVNATFRIVVFRPFKGEILEGQISQSTSEGMRVTLGFFDSIFIPAPVNLFEATEFNLSESLWTWATEQGIAFFDLFERVRFRVEAELWRDVAPQGPEGPSLEMAVNGMRSLGPASDDDSMAEASQGPYSIIDLKGSMQQEGLGLVQWWED